MPPCSVSSIDCICSSVSADVMFMPQSQNFKKIVLASAFPVYIQASLNPAYNLCTLYQGTHPERYAVKSPFCKVLHIALLFGTPPTYPFPQSLLFISLAAWQALSSVIMYSIRLLHSALLVAA